jgi:hypothetical protein
MDGSPFAFMGSPYDHGQFRGSNSSRALNLTLARAAALHRPMSAGIGVATFIRNLADDIVIEQFSAQITCNRRLIRYFEIVVRPTSYLCTQRCAVFLISTQYRFYSNKFRLIRNRKRAKSWLIPVDVVSFASGLNYPAHDRFSPLWCGAS